jgi:hypothetical protein
VSAATDDDVEAAMAALTAALHAVLPDLLHDWVLLAEYDGAYALHRCRVCRTELVR